MFSWAEEEDHYRNLMSLHLRPVFLGTGAALAEFSDFIFIRDEILLSICILSAPLALKS